MFTKLQEEYPTSGDYIILTKLVNGKGYGEDFISRLLTKFVSRDEYEKGDKALLLKHLVKLSI